ncbi:hypothetical protein V3851_01980 [Paenibacillus sp. M1]|uniref:YgiT-type zinc finger domain-containing protein n=1 Tax=Paenibacillus haidiansis TaxID=1574488 RepID=A0ABU7VLE4_9BACL
MRKQCRCGHTMSLGFRLVIFEHKFQVDRVPIFECDECDYYEIFPSVKEDLLDVLGQLKRKGEGGRIYFTEVNEFADILFELREQYGQEDPNAFEALVQQACEERINLLLDLYGCAQKINDPSWMDEIAARLSTLSNFAKYRAFLGAK